jgi:hypothetical protein
MLMMVTLAKGKGMVAALAERTEVMVTAVRARGEEVEMVVLAKGKGMVAALAERVELMITVLRARG